MVIAANLFSFDLFGLTRRKGDDAGKEQKPASVSSETRQSDRDDVKLGEAQGIFYFGLFPVL
ncbi:hypothetical protein [Rhizobium paknamense]|uniref:Uncharacterized protein n=1 Tax=Rhizobium paknamense TaxID=1206817 RepID=A0ABU0IDW7_9HYPH|nr:hypothetical protein [Rhizobium paknamense]MDQ0456439.1 hypothetical protein [Rhizobium paknamense]